MRKDLLICHSYSVSFVLSLLLRLLFSAQFPKETKLFSPWVVFYYLFLNLGNPVLSIICFDILFKELWVTCSMDLCIIFIMLYLSLDKISRSEVAQQFRLCGFPSALVSCHFGFQLYPLLRSVAVYSSGCLFFVVSVFLLNLAL